MTAKPNRRSRQASIARREPVLLRGTAAIGAHLDMTSGEVDHLHRTGALLTFRAGGTPYATVRALDDWRTLRLAGNLPNQ
jgi:hypothetical protein